MAALPQPELPVATLIASDSEGWSTMGNAFLDATLRLQRGPDGVVLVPGVRHTMNDAGIIHTAVGLTIAQEASFWTAIQGYPIDKMLTAQLSGWLLRPTYLHGGPVTGVGRLIKRGRSLVVAEGTAYQEAAHGREPVAHVITTFVPDPTVRELVEQHFGPVRLPRGFILG